VKQLLEPLADRAPVDTGKLFGDGFDVVLLTGSVTGKDRKRALEKAASGEAMILVGTHALIQEGVEFHRLGLAIVDEQHRFGVHQRIALRAKGVAGAQPDTLIMTATPIPRTLSLTLYGDLDVGTLDEMPPGRIPVTTAVARDEFSRARAYRMIRTEVARGRQAFIICPLVEDSASLEVKAAESEFERIRSEVAKTDFNHNGHRMPVTVSVGVATTLDKAANSANDLVSIADGYLYRAKRGGKNAVVQTTEAGPGQLPLLPH